MYYLLEYVLPSDPSTVRAAVVARAFSCTRDELPREIARVAASSIRSNFYPLNFSSYSSLEGAEVNAKHCYPKAASSDESTQIEALKERDLKPRIVHRERDALAVHLNVASEEIEVMARCRSRDRLRHAGVDYIVCHWSQRVRRSSKGMGVQAFNTWWEIKRVK